MRAYPIFFLYALILLLASCSKDQGNYDYTEVNKLTILDTGGTSMSDLEFDITGDDTIVVEAVAKGTLASFDPNTIQYTWLVGKDTIGKGPKLNMVGGLFKPGENKVSLYARDPSTNLDYLHIFIVHANATITKGVVLLTQDEQDNSILYLKSSRSPLSKWYRMTSLGINNEYPLGKHPIAVDLRGANRAYPSFTIVTRDGPNPVILVDLPTMLPYYSIKGEGAGINGGDFHPTYFHMGFSAQNGDSYVLDKGRVRYLKRGFLGPDVLLKEQKYDFGTQGISYDGFYSMNIAGNFLMGYDKISKRILFFESSKNKKFSFPNISEEKSTEVLGDMEYVGSGMDMLSTGNSFLYGIVLRKGTEVHSYSTTYQRNSNRVYEFSKIKENATATIPNIDKALNLQLNKWTGFYYYAVGRTIYRFPFFSLAVQPYFTLPEDGSGDIVCWNFDKDESVATHSNIGIATYNPTSKEPKKGSYYHYEIKTDATGKPLTLVSKNLYELEKVVSISLGIR